MSSDSELSEAINSIFGWYHQHATTCYVCLSDTAIPITALLGRSLSEFGVEERFLWAQRRFHEA
ncbi:hypothetical protein M433DRAFT_147196 [Acidomyces richmondensis BFW]|nr:hypothetical protein M433DRAFT_147196 [Acidomyces richmondensis BFW]